MPKNPKSSEAAPAEPQAVEVDAMSLGYVEHSFTSPIASDPTYANRLTAAKSLVESVTLFSPKLSQPLVLDPRNLDYDALSWLAVECYTDAQTGLYLATQQWQILADLMVDAIPKSPSSRYRRGYQFLPLQDLQKAASDMVEAAAKTPQGAALQATNWQAVVKRLLTLIVEAAFVPLDIIAVDAVRPHVEFHKPATRMPKYEDVRAVAAVAAIKDALIRAAPSEAFNDRKLPMFSQMMFAAAIREYFLDLGLALGEAGYRSDLLIKTALRVVHTRMNYRAGITPANSLIDLPVSYFDSPKLTALMTNYTVIKAASEYAGVAGQDPVAGQYEYEAAIDRLLDTTRNAYFFETCSVRQLQDKIGVRCIKDSADRRAAMLVSYHDTISQSSVAAFTVRQTTSSRYVQLRPSALVQPSLNAFNAALPALSTVDADGGIIRALSRDSDESQARKARVFVSAQLDVDGSSRWLLELAAMSKATRTYAIPSGTDWKFAYVIEPRQALFAQRVSSATGGIVTGDPLLSIYLTFEDQEQKDDVEFSLLSFDRLPDGWVRFGDLRTASVLLDPQYLSGPMADLTNIAGLPVSLHFGTYRQFMDLDLRLNTAFVAEGRFAAELNRRVGHAISGVAAIAGLVDSGIAQKSLDIDARQTLMPLYTWCQKAASSAAFAQRINAAIDAVIGSQPDVQLKAKVTVQCAREEIRAEIEVSTVLLYLQGAGLLTPANVQQLRNLFVTYNMHEAVGAYASRKDPHMLAIR